MFLKKFVVKTWEELIGGTPLVRLERLSVAQKINIYAKLEMFNLGGSIKDRPALFMIKEALRSGVLKKGWTVVESTSGNMGIGLALVCLRFGLKFIAVVDSRTTTANINIMKSLGATVEIVHQPDPGKSFLETRLRKVKEILESTSNSFWANQYANEDNARAHVVTIQEVDKALNGKIDYLFCAVSTCGTIRGCSDYLRAKRRKTKIVAVDAVGSVIFGGEAKPRFVPGHGAGVRPALYRDQMADRVIHIDDRECVDGCKTLLKEEAILAGGSSGAVVSAFFKMREDIPRGSNVVLILADRGERYADSIYNEDWVSQHLGV